MECSPRARIGVDFRPTVRTRPTVSGWQAGGQANGWAAVLHYGRHLGSGAASFGIREANFVNAISIESNATCAYERRMENRPY